jgi:hypothetical protein
MSLPKPGNQNGAGWRPAARGPSPAYRTWAPAPSRQYLGSALHQLIEEHSFYFFLEDDRFTNLSDLINSDTLLCLIFSLRFFF